MASQYLSVFVQNALEENEELLQDVLTGRADVETLLTFCENFRLAGIGALFLGSAPKLFRQMLHYSGRAYAHSLGRAGLHTALTSKANPFFDAVGAGDFDAAALIAQVSRRDWVQGEEYEEDFLFVEFLMQRFFLGATPQSGAAMLERYEASLQGAEDCRLPMCHALLNRDSQAFNSALTTFLGEREELLTGLSDGGAVSDEVAATEGNLCVPGLALVKLAERDGLETEQDYLHVPSSARKGGLIAFSPDDWRMLWG